MTNYSDESTDVICQSCPSGRQKVIYLTFDDGPEPGTLEIYYKLKELKVPATFFFVGENVIAQELGHLNLSNNRTEGSGVFKMIFEDALFQVGNHSQSQSHQFYRSYYNTGLRIDSGTLAPSADLSKPEGRRSVLVDFELASVAFTHALNEVAQQYFSDRQKVTDYGYRGEDVSGLFSGYGITHYRFLTGRMPGTNRWRIPGNTSGAWDSGANRDDEADDLYSNSYRIYGWDVEWYFNKPDNSSVMSEDVNFEHKQGQDGWWDGYYTEKNKNDDRLKESVDQMFSEIKDHLEWLWDNTWFESSDDSKCVVLMHDRQFRDNPDGSNPYIEKLARLIKKCQDAGYKFDVLENY